MKGTRDLVKRALFLGGITFGIMGAGDLTPDSWKAQAQGKKQASKQGHGSGEVAEPMVAVLVNVAVMDVGIKRKRKSTRRADVARMDVARKRKAKVVVVERMAAVREDMAR